MSNISFIISNLIEKYVPKNIYSSIEDNLEINIRPNSIRRCLSNLIDNGLTYGKKIEITSAKTNDNISIFVDDDGPGISEKEFFSFISNLFKFIGFIKSFISIIVRGRSVTWCPGSIFVNGSKRTKTISYNVIVGVHFQGRIATDMRLLFEVLLPWLFLNPRNIY